MKTIKDFINEDNTVNEAKLKLRDEMNILVPSCGSMYREMDTVEELVNAYDAKLIDLYYYDRKGVHQVNSIEEIPTDGPHVPNLDEVYKFANAHAGELTLIMYV